MTLLLLGCGLWIGRGEQAEKLESLGVTDPFGTEGDADTDADADADADADLDEVVLETVLEVPEPVGTTISVSFSHHAEDGVLSRLAYCGPFGGENSGYVSSVYHPADFTEVYSAGDVEALPTRGGYFPDGVPFLLPVSPDFPVLDGSLEYAYSVSAQGVAFDCRAVSRYDEARASGRLAVRVVYTGPDHTAADAEDPPWAAGWQWTAESFLSTGLTVDLSFEDADCGPSEVRDAGDLRSLGDCLGRPGEREVVLVVADRVLAEDAEPDQWGWTLAPGVPVVGEGAHAVAVLDARVADEGERAITRSAVHQIGHALGLFDVYTSDGLWQDPIADTPTCAYEPPLDWGDCTSSSVRDNAMWPFADDSTTASFTTDQGWVVRRSAAVRP